MSESVAGVESAAAASRTPVGGPSSGRAGIDPNAVYSLGSSGGESERLRRQADELAPESAAALDRAGLRSGHNVIDVGCGPRGIIEMLCERVSPGGRVVGLDSDPAHVAMAADLVAHRGLRGVQIIEADARHTGLAGDSFDVVHARTLLVNVPEPAEVLAEMVRLARRGGRVVSVEPDCETCICYPPHPAFDRLAELFAVAFARNGADPNIGRRLAELYRDAGLEDVTIEARAGVYAHGHSRRTIRPDLVRTLRSQILALGAADEQELDELDAAARTHLADPNVMVMPSLYFLATGRKPALPQSDTPPDGATARRP
ncbi:MAG: methyltransferase domain-containing protein [Solirubrobacterales bacterium]|nr:methyltransferase domain-containing protein [Solirubrobacterales bacterium]